MTIYTMKYSIPRTFAKAVVATAIAAFFSGLTTAQVPSAPVTPTEPAKGSVSQLNWLAGCWQAKVARDNSTIHETWFSPRGGSVMGVGLTYRDDKTLTSEAMRMYDEGGTVKLWMRPAGRAELTMALETIGDPFVAFFVKEGEVTTKLRYEKKSATELVATFRVEQGESRRGADFGFNKIDCAEVFLPEVKEVKAPEKK
jgi:hypothetical protein